MAESAVNFLLEKLIAEASLLGGLGDEVRMIMQELQCMQAFLRDADKRRDSNKELKIWVRQVREAAYDVEVFVDEFVYSMHAPSSGFSDLIRKHGFATHLQKINKNVREISARRNRYNLSSTEHEANKGRQRSRETFNFKKKVDVVGMKNEFDSIVNWLLEEDRRLTVISVTGMGGLGKTTLVSKAFKHSKVKNNFHCFAWVSVSQTLRIEELFRSIIKQLFDKKEKAIPSNLDAMGVEDLQQLIKHRLQRKRYVIVLDDVWTIKDWEEIKNVFQDHNYESRLMVTTRNVEVARAATEGGRHICTLRPLNEEEARELFNKKAFRNEPCPSHLDSLAGRIVKKCEGLPLAIIAMVGLLLTKEKNVREWNNVCNSLNWQLSKNPSLQSLHDILLRSFNHLPYYLKHCFLYCSMFPEDYPIKRKRSIRLWVAEGFVKERGGMTMEEVAEDCLNELIHRNMLQVAEVNVFGRVKACRMHHMMREVAISLSRDDDFSLACDAPRAGQVREFHRISIYDDNREILKSASMGSSRLHSVIVFNKKNAPFSDSLLKMASSFRWLKVLDLKGTQIGRVPDELVELFRLRYLNLAKTGIGELPESVEKLRNLQTLDLRETKIKRLPNGIGKLQNLRHLFYYQVTDSEFKSFNSWKSSKFPPQLCNITSLQSIGMFEVEGETVRQIGNLTQLRCLSIANVRATDVVELCASIREMKQLVRLSIGAIREEETLELEALSAGPPLLLQKLYLRGHLERVPQWLGSLNNLACLGLYWSKLREEEEDGLLSTLQALPNLVNLYLWKAYDGQQLVFKEGWFSKLKQLWLQDLTQLSQVIVERGAMPSLRELRLIRCGELKALPQGIEHLLTLQELHLQEMPMELVDRLRVRNGNAEEDRQKVAKIRIIRHALKSEKGQWNYEELK